MLTHVVSTDILITEVLAEEAAVRSEADKVRAKKEEIEMARGITVEDLTKGLLNYRFTGLNFAKGEKGTLKCVILIILVIFFQVAHCQNVVSDFCFTLSSTGSNLQNLTVRTNRDHLLLL